MLTQVAILFLTRGKMPLEPAWREFFAAAAMVEPIDVDRLWAPDLVAPRNVTAELAAIDERDAAAARRGGIDPRKVGSAVAAAARRAGAGSARLARREDGATVATVARTEDSGAAARRRLLRIAWTGWWASEPDTIAAQDLFSVYVHPPPGKRFRAGSLFSGREVPDRVAVSWAQHSVVRCLHHVTTSRLPKSSRFETCTSFLMPCLAQLLSLSKPCTSCGNMPPLQAEAERSLLRAALADPANQRFLLASESCLPMYPPHVLYAELISSGRSRIHACKLDTWEEQKRRLDWKCVLCNEFISSPWRGLQQGLTPRRCCSASVQGAPGAPNCTTIVCVSHRSKYQRRWVPTMETERLRKDFWRKSPQWFALNRRHAEARAHLSLVVSPAKSWAYSGC